MKTGTRVMPTTGIKATGIMAIMAIMAIMVTVTKDMVAMITLATTTIMDMVTTTVSKSPRRASLSRQLFHSFSVTFEIIKKPDFATHF